MCSLPCDVHQATGHSLVRVEVQLKHSELLREECTRLILDSGKTVKRMKEDDSKRLGKKTNHGLLVCNDKDLCSVSSDEQTSTSETSSL